MPFIPILAHGALGIFDELIFISVAAIFLVMMGISWVNSRNQSAEATEAELTQAEETPPSSPTVAQPANDDPEKADHFRLE